MSLVITQPQKHLCCYVLSNPSLPKVSHWKTTKYKSPWTRQSEPQQLLRHNPQESIRTPSTASSMTQILYKPRPPHSVGGISLFTSLPSRPVFTSPFASASTKGPSRLLSEVKGRGGEIFLLSCTRRIELGLLCRYLYLLKYLNSPPQFLLRTLLVEANLLCIYIWQ